MKILVIGSGAREHALCWRLHQSQSVWGLFCAPGNPGIAQIANTVPIAMSDASALIDFAKKNAIDLTVVGPDDPLAAGIVDQFQDAGLKIFGPTRAAAQLEASKWFAKEVMRSAGVPTAESAIFTEVEAARKYVREHGVPIVVKADGLALGKGVTVCADIAIADAAIVDALERKRFGESGARIVIEKFLAGEEVTLFALCDGTDAVPFGLFQDHKRIHDGDVGPNTGGMGAYSPLPQFATDVEARAMREIIVPTVAAMKARGTPFKGLLYAGLMVDGTDIKVVEFNARFGDPECEPLMMRFDGDLAQTLLAAVEGQVMNANVALSPRSAVTVILASDGYPGEYRKGVPIFGLEKVEGDTPSELKVKWAMKKIRVKVFHAGTALKDGKIVTAGGRVLAVTASAPVLPAAVEAAYEAAALIDFEGKQMRTDIARRALVRSPETI